MSNHRLTAYILAAACVTIWIGFDNPVLSQSNAQTAATISQRIDRLERVLVDTQTALAVSHQSSNHISKRLDDSPQVKLHGRLEQDWLWITGPDSLESDVGILEDGVFFRRARIQALGSLNDFIDFSAEFEFANVESTVFQDVWMQLNHFGSLGKLRAGHLKVPFGLDNETSAKHLTFLERSAVHDAMQQEYDPGIMIWDTFANDDFRYAVAYLRFDPGEDGTALGNGQHSFAARISGTPRHSEDDRRLIHLGGAIRINDGSYDPVSGAEGFRFRARPEFRNTPRFVDTGFFEADSATFLGAEAAVVLDSLSLQYEFVSARTSDTVFPSSSLIGNADFYGYYCQATYFLTGEHRPYSRSNGGFGRVVPLNPVHRLNSDGLSWGGALELKARYSNVDLSDEGISGGELENTSVGFNWYLTSTAKVMCDYLWSRRHAATTHDSHGFAMRLYVEF